MREVLLDSKLTFSKPQDRLFAGQIDRMDRFALRFRARKYQSEQYRLPFAGLRGMRASLIPHQLHIAHEVGQRHAPRVLLADEVGLGKTIEAGMIIHQQLLAGRAERVLIVVPETLQHQWLVEMMRRFNLYFSLFDDSRYAEAKLDSSNPFETEQLVICSLDFVRRNKQRTEELADAQWDLLVVDEAHHGWSEEAPSREYQVIEQLAEHIPGVLLLTATPEQLGQQSHFARLRLLDPSRFHDYGDFVAEQQKYRPVADAVTLLLSGERGRRQAEPAGRADRRAGHRTAAQSGQQRRRQRRAGAPRAGGHADGSPRHQPRAVPQHPQRREGLPTPQPAPDQAAVADPVSDCDQSLRHHGRQEVRRSARARHAVSGADLREFEGENATVELRPARRVAAGLPAGQPQRKVLVICAKADTALQLEQMLREREAIRAAVFHEGLSIIERDRAAAYFASEEEGAQVLLCSGSAPKAATSSSPVSW